MPKKCFNCGNLYSVDTHRCVCGEGLIYVQKECLSCGRVVEEDATKCECGAKLSGPWSKSEKTYPKTMTELCSYLALYPRLIVKLPSYLKEYTYGGFNGQYLCFFCAASDVKLKIPITDRMLFIADGFVRFAGSAKAFYYYTGPKPWKTKSNERWDDVIANLELFGPRYGMGVGK